MSRIQRGFGKALIGAALALSVLVPLGAAAQAADIIYDFTGGADGVGPQAGLVRDTAGNFYGTAAGGGSGISGCGVVFKLSPLGVETTLYTFKGGSDGCEPLGKLIADAAGNLYGTTYGGGAHNEGAVFKLTPGGEETVLYSFAGGSDGANPHAGLIADAAGNFYGTTNFGGGAAVGTVFKLAPNGTETVLHAFTGGRDGSYAYEDLIMDKRGALYGTANGGGQYASGVIFKIAPNGKFSVLYSFTGLADGGAPLGLFRDKQGVFYGATARGGIPACDCGVVFKLAPDGTQTVLHSFTGSDGSIPRGSLIMDKQGNLFGVTAGGGGFGDGTVFQLSPDGTETVLHSFAGSPDGASPAASLILYMNKLYGTTTAGGTGSACGANGCGTVFEVRKAK